MKKPESGDGRAKRRHTRRRQGGDASQNSDAAGKKSGDGLDGDEDSYIQQFHAERSTPSGREFHASLFENFHADSSSAPRMRRKMDNGDETSEAPQPVLLLPRATRDFSNGDTGALKGRKDISVRRDSGEDFVSSEKSSDEAVRKLEHPVENPRLPIEDEEDDTLSRTKSIFDPEKKHAPLHPEEYFTSILLSPPSPFSEAVSSFFPSLDDELETSVTGREHSKESAAPLQSWGGGGGPPFSRSILSDFSQPLGGSIKVHVTAHNTEMQQKPPPEHPSSSHKTIVFDSELRGLLLTTLYDVLLFIFVLFCWLRLRRYRGDFVCGGDEKKSATRDAQHVDLDRAAAADVGNRDAGNSAEFNRAPAAPRESRDSPRRDVRLPTELDDMASADASCRVYVAATVEPSQENAVIEGLQNASKEADAAAPYRDVTVAPAATASGGNTSRKEEATVAANAAARHADAAAVSAHETALAAVEGEELREGTEAQGEDRRDIGDGGGRRLFRTAICCCPKRPVFRSSWKECFPARMCLAMVGGLGDALTILVQVYRQLTMPLALAHTRSCTGRKVRVRHKRRRFWRMHAKRQSATAGKRATEAAAAAADGKTAAHDAVDTTAESSSSNNVATVARGTLQDSSQRVAEGEHFATEHLEGVQQRQYEVERTGRSEGGSKGFVQSKQKQAEKRAKKEQQQQGDVGGGDRPVQPSLDTKKEETEVLPDDVKKKEQQHVGIESARDGAGHPEAGKTSLFSVRPALTTVKRGEAREHEDTDLTRQGVAEKAEDRESPAGLDKSRSKKLHSHSRDETPAPLPSEQFAAAAGLQKSGVKQVPAAGSDGGEAQRKGRRSSKVDVLGGESKNDGVKLREANGCMPETRPRVNLDRMEPKRTEDNALANQSSIKISRTPPTIKELRMAAAWAMADIDIETLRGDMACYFHFLDTLLWCCKALSLGGLLLLMPIYLTTPAEPSQDRNYLTLLDLFSAADRIAPHALWLMFLACWVFSGIVYYAVYALWQHLDDIRTRPAVLITLLRASHALHSTRLAAGSSSTLEEAPFSGDGGVSVPMQPVRDSGSSSTKHPSVSSPQHDKLHQHDLISSSSTSPPSSSSFSSSFSTATGSGGSCSSSFIGDNFGATVAAVEREMERQNAGYTKSSSAAPAVGGGQRDPLCGGQSLSMNRLKMYTTTDEEGGDMDGVSESQKRGGGGGGGRRRRMVKEKRRGRGVTDNDGNSGSSFDGSEEEREKAVKKKNEGKKKRDQGPRSIGRGGRNLSNPALSYVPDIPVTSGFGESRGRRRTHEHTMEDGDRSAGAAAAAAASASAASTCGAGEAGSSSSSYSAYGSDGVPASSSSASSSSSYGGGWSRYSHLTTPGLQVVAPPQYYSVILSRLVRKYVDRQEFAQSFVEIHQRFCTVCCPTSSKWRGMLLRQMARTPSIVVTRSPAPPFSSSSSSSFSSVGLRAQDNYFTTTRPRQHTYLQRGISKNIRPNIIGLPRDSDGAASDVMEDMYTSSRYFNEPSQQYHPHRGRGRLTKQNSLEDRVCPDQSSVRKAVSRGISPPTAVQDNTQTSTWRGGPRRHEALDATADWIRRKTTTSSAKEHQLHKAPTSGNSSTSFQTNPISDSATGRTGVPPWSHSSTVLTPHRGGVHSDNTTAAISSADTDNEQQQRLFFSGGEECEHKLARQHAVGDGAADQDTPSSCSGSLCVPGLSVDCQCTCVLNVRLVLDIDKSTCLYKDAGSTEEYRNPDDGSIRRRSSGSTRECLGDSDGRIRHTTCATSHHRGTSMTDESASSSTNSARQWPGAPTAMMPLAAGAAAAAIDGKDADAASSSKTAERERDERTPPRPPQPFLSGKESQPATAMRMENERSRQLDKERQHQNYQDNVCLNVSDQRKKRSIYKAICVPFRYRMCSRALSVIEGAAPSLGAFAHMSISTAAHPADIQWDNLHLSRLNRILRMVLLNTTLVVLCLTIISPVVLLSELSPIMGKIDAQWRDHRIGFLTLTWFWLKSKEAAYVVHGNIAFQLLNTLILPLLSLSSIESVLRLMYTSELATWSVLLGYSLVHSSGGFAMRYLVNLSFLGTANELLQIYSIIAAKVDAYFFDIKERKKYPFDLGYAYAQTLSVFTLLLLFSVVVPLLLPLGLLYLFCRGLVDRYNFVYHVHTRLPFESDGRLVTIGMKYMLFAVSFLQFAMAGFFCAQKQSTVLVVAGSLMFFFSILSWVCLCSFTIPAPGGSAGREAARRLEHHPRDEQVFLPRQRRELRDAYKQPCGKASKCDCDKY